MTGSTDTPSANLHLLPGEGDGRLRTADGDSLPVRTFKRGPDVVLVVMVDVDEAEAEELTGGAELEYTSVRGIVRLHGEAIFEDRSLVRFEADGEPEVTQRRSFVRVHAPRVVALESADGAERWAQTVDLSGGGMLIGSASALEADQVVHFAMNLGDGQAAITGLARVVRASGEERRALVFERIDEADRQRLIRFVFACMRTARARTRGDFL